MNVIFFGNTKYSVIDAEIINRRFRLSAVVTIPNRIVSRKQILTSPVKAFAEKNNIPVITADKLDQKVIEQIKATKPDFLAVADYGLILPQTVLDIPNYAPLNVHHSLLPKFRGPAPAPATILSGEKISGVTIIKMNTQVDAGDILKQVRYELTPDETTDSLLIHLNELGAQAALDVIANYQHIKPVKQNESDATFTTYLSKQDGFITIEHPPDTETLTRMIRAYYPWPGVWTRFRLSYGGQAKEKIIKFLPKQKLQIEGKRPVGYKDFINGYPEGKIFLEKLQLL